MIDPKQKSLLIKIGIGLVVLFGLAYFFSDDGEDKANEDARIYARVVNTAINDVDIIVDSPVKDSYVYNPDELLRLLQDIHRQLVDISNQINALEDEVKSKNRVPQPQYVVDACKNHIQQIEQLCTRGARLQAEAEALYVTTLAKWEEEAKKPDSTGDDIKKAEAILAKFPEYKEEIIKRRDACESGWKARGVYNRLLKRLKIKELHIRAKLDILKQKYEQANAARAQVIGDGNEVDHTKPKVKEIDAVINAIRAFDFKNRKLVPPAVKPEPKPVPPPEFKPDLVLTATGDLPETLLQPLVESWLTAGRATPVKGNRFIWDTRHGNKELEVNAPADMQGAQAGKLCIRIVPVDGVDAAFRSVGLCGHTHVMLTGANPSREALAEWLPEGQNPQDLGRSYKARICYDALVFFRGDSLDLKTPLRSAIMKKQPMVFSVGDAARSEAVQVFGLAPAAHDVTEQQNMDTRALCTKYADKIVLGVWHKDAVSALAFREQPTICYAAGWESEEAFKNVPKEYLPETEGVSPNAATIASGRYAYSYSIYGYRTTRDKASRASVLAAQLLAYMADAENAQVAQTVRDGGFVPVDIAVDKMSRTQELTKDDLPLPVLLKAMGSTAESFGYDAEDAAWVYGVRIPFAMYFKTGSAKGGDEQVTLDADAEYYTSTEAFARIQELIKDGRAAIVVLGHADVQHGGGLKVDRASWKSNLALSQKRAKFTGDALKKKIPGNKSLHRVAVGTGWARPACDISLTKPIDEQENELARCRRAEVFIIFPVPGSGT